VSARSNADANACLASRDRVQHRQDIGIFIGQTSRSAAVTLLRYRRSRDPSDTATDTRAEGTVDPGIMRAVPRPEDGQTDPDAEA